jgi:glycosyltransferase involved in cell wall biosynthesis
MTSHNKPLVSVIIPSYNHEQYIGEAIESALASSISEIEVLVVEDGSTDDSLKAIASIKDPRVRLFRQQNLGAHAAINRGVEMASAPWVAILNSDDRFLPTKLERHLDLHREDPSLEAGASRVRYIDADGKPLPVDGYHVRNYERAKKAGTKHDTLFASLLGRNHLVTTSCLFVCKEVFRELGGFPPLRYVHDWFMFLTLAGRGRFLVVEEELAEYRRHGSNTIAENDERGRIEDNFVLEWQLSSLLSSGSSVPDLPEAMEILRTHERACYRLMIFFGMWRQSNGNNLRKATEIFAKKDHPVLKHAADILRRDRSPVDIRVLLKRLFGSKSVSVADRVLKGRSYLNRLLKPVKE